MVRNAHPATIIDVLRKPLDPERRNVECRRPPGDQVGDDAPGRRAAA
jgi:hypothetical protein